MIVRPRARRSSPRARAARSRVLGVLGVLLLALLASLTAGAAQPAAAEAPAGSQAELIFAEKPEYTTPLDSGTFTTSTYAVPLPPPYDPEEAGCTATQRVAFAFVLGSADPSRLGSPERPLVSPGATVESLFTWPAPRSLGNFSYQLRPDFLVGPADDQVPMDQRWAADTLVSLVATCISGRGDEPSEWTVVAGPDGHAITSWLQFTTVASPTDSTRTSAGFTIGAIREQPQVTLDGTSDDAGAELVATVTDASAVVLPRATGRIDFWSRNGSEHTLAGTAQLDQGVARLRVPAPEPSGQAVYEAQYVPDPAAAGSFKGALSRRYAVVGAAVVLPPELSVTAPGSTYGKPGQVAVQVRRAGVAASGEVVVVLDGAELTRSRLLSGRLRAATPALLGGGQHTVRVDYLGDATTSPGSTTTSFTTARAATTVSVEKKTSKGEERRGSPAGRRKVRLAIAVSGPAPSQVPTGTVEVRVKGKVIAVELKPGGTATVTLPTSRKKRRTTALVTYTGTNDFAPATQELEVKLRRPKGKGSRP